MALTAIQQRIGNITVPPTPKMGASLTEVQQATATWTKQAQQALVTISKVLGQLDTSQIPQGGSNVIGNVPTPPGVYFTPELARAAVSATAPLVYDSGTGIFSIPTSSATANGYLSSTDWNIFNNKVSTTRLLNTTSPLLGGGDLSADRTFSIQDAAADGATKGAATFLASDFNSSSGLISLDYTNGQKASASLSGFLLAADWVTFNAKVGTARLINTTAPLTGGGDLSADRTFAIAKATTSIDGYLAATDWTIFNAKVGTARLINTTAPLTGGGDLSADRTFAIPKATTSVDGYLAATDWNIFNTKVSTTLTISTTSPLLGGGNLSANRTFSIQDAAADGSTKGAATFLAADFNSSSGLISIDYLNGQKASPGISGFLSATDWTTFTNKVAKAGDTMSGSLTISPGFIAADYLSLPSTTSSVLGVVLLNSVRFLHAFGTSNVFLGPRSGNFSLTGSSNSGLGADTMPSLTSGVFNAAIGDHALFSVTSGNNNMAMGPFALANLTTTNDNLGIGVSALRFGTGGTQNVAVGNAALLNASGSNNVAIGYSALRTLTSASANTAVGETSGFSLTTGTQNVLLGTESGFALTTASGNVFIGFDAGYTDGTNVTPVTGSNMTAIGYKAQVTISNALVLGGVGANAVKVGIGTTAPTTTLDVTGTANISGATSFGSDLNVAGSIITTGLFDTANAVIGISVNDDHILYDNSGGAIATFNTGAFEIGAAAVLRLGSVGFGLQIKEGTNAVLGSATLAAGSAVVSTTKVTANSRIFLTTNGGVLLHVGAPYVSARTAGTSFTISSTNALDTSTVAWHIIEPI